MTIPINYSEAEICDIIIWRRESFTWEETASKFNKKYGRSQTAEAVRGVYKRYGNLHDITDERFVVETLKTNVRKTIQASKMAKENRAALTATLTLEDVFERLKEMMPKLKTTPVARKALPSTHSHHSTLEAMISDWHLGVTFDGYGIKEAKKRLQEFTNTLLAEIDKTSKVYTLDKVIIALMGDIINSASMHGMESSRDCEIGNSEQVALATKLLFEVVLKPMAQLDIDIFVPCVPGNHDRAEHTKTFVYPGKHNLTWIIYNALQLLCEQAGFDNITFDITEEYYIISKIYGDVIIWEHGDQLRGKSQQAIENHIQKRQQQIGSMIDFFRFGHFHEYRMYGRGRVISNASICGQTSFSKVLGYNSVASQTINTYIKTKNRPTSFYQSFPVYLGG